MFNEQSRERAAVLLANYGATHFRISAEGELAACNEHGAVVIVDAPDVQLGNTPSEIAAAETAYALEVAQATAAQKKAPEKAGFFATFFAALFAKAD